MKLTDMIVSYILKGGILSESRNLDVEIDIPESSITVKIKCEHMTIKMERGGNPNE